MKHLILFILALLPATILAQVDVEARIDSLEMMQLNSSACGNNGLQGSPNRKVKYQALHL